MRANSIKTAIPRNPRPSRERTFMSKLSIAPKPPQQSLSGVPPRRRTRISKACEICRFLRVKVHRFRPKIPANQQCDGKHPCSQCIARNDQCLYSANRIRAQTLASSKEYVPSLYNLSVAKFLLCKTESQSLRRNCHSQATSPLRRSHFPTIIHSMK
jgi:hypothetical protein